MFDGGRMRYRCKKICLLVLIALVPGLAWAERMAVVAETANVRTGPGTDYEVAWQIGRHHPVEVIKKEGKWYLFKDFENDQGWIYSPLVGKISTVVVKKGDCNVRSGPSTSDKVIFKVDSGVPFKVKKRTDSWLNIVHDDGDEGWIHKSLVW